MERWACMRYSGSPGTRISSKPSAFGSVFCAATRSSMFCLYSSTSVKAAMSSATRKLFCTPRDVGARPVMLGSNSGLPTMMFESVANIRASPEPFGPANGSNTLSKLGTVVGFPSGSSDHSVGIDTPLSWARLSFPPATTLVAMSRTSGSRSLAGTAMAMGLLCTPLPFEPKGAMLGGLHTTAIPAMP